MAFECAETEKDKIDTTHGAGGAPWRNDSVEIYLRILSSPYDLLHLIVDPDGHTYRAIEDHHTRNGKREAIHWPATVAASQEKGRWFVEVAVPLAKLGATGKAAAKGLGFNFGRTRHAASTAHYTLAPGNRFATMDRYFLDLK